MEIDLRGRQGHDVGDVRNCSSRAMKFRHAGSDRNVQAEQVEVSRMIMILSRQGRQVCSGAPRLRVFELT